MTDFPFGVVLLGGAGVVAGLVLLARGFSSFGRATLIADTTVSRISSLAVGEVAVSGTIEAAEVTLIAPITSEPCVYYRARIDRRSGDSEGSSFNEERAVGFTIRDAGGAIRVFPRGARFDIPDDLDARTGTFGETPPGVRLRHGPSSVATDLDREAMVAQLLTVRPAARFPGGGEAGAGLGIGAGIGLSDVLGAGLVGGAGEAQDRYREARLAPGDVVTVVGKALPFAELEDPAGADVATATDAVDDPDLAAQLDAYRSAGLLAASPEDAWGNAAIPGFGIGRPVSAPVIHSEARQLPLASAEEAERADRVFTIEPRALVLASTADVRLIVADGNPSDASAREEGRFLVGLLGAILAIGSVIFLAFALSGGLGGVEGGP